MLRWPFIVVLILSIWRLLATIHDDVWWSKRVHLVAAIVLLLLTLVDIVVMHSSSSLVRNIVVSVMTIDLGAGIVTSFWKMR